MKLKRAGFQRLFVALLMLSLLLTTMHQAAAEATKQGAIASQSTQFIDIVINGQPIDSKAKPLLIDGKLMVPLKPLAEAVGATYHWDVKKKQITLQSGQNPWFLRSDHVRTSSNLPLKL
ncbi:stalk domain-containing protein [Paenibacillus alvei]|uniref:stalk domain-containing protein n=2 Tax=Paenibacillus TaxID=44249 RepID=UPI003D3030FE